jgi:RimJ/RimL family protein N-acetyltransferase
MSELRREGEHNFWATTVPENLASAKVLENLGFTQIDSIFAPALLSFDEGDRVFNLKDKTSDSH